MARLQAERQGASSRLRGAARYNRFFRGGSREVPWGVPMDTRVSIPADLGYKQPLCCRYVLLKHCCRAESVEPAGGLRIAAPEWATPGFVLQVLGEISRDRRQ